MTSRFGGSNQICRAPGGARVKQPENYYREGDDFLQFVSTFLGTVNLLGLKNSYEGGGSGGSATTTFFDEGSTAEEVLSEALRSYDVMFGQPLISATGDRRHRKIGSRR